LEQTITKNILKEELFAGRRPAVELLYNRYSGMLFSYILQFVPDREEAGVLLADVFSRLIPQLQEAFDSSLSLFCWLQVETRKIVLAYLKEKGNGHREAGADLTGRRDKGYYSSLMADASPEHQWIFREMFIYGRDKEGLAIQSGKDLAYISRLLRECLSIIRKNLG
jgi:hypothetical protein